MKRISLSLVVGIVLAGAATVAVATRNSSGTFSLPSGNPVVSGTSISSTSFNSTMNELAQGITDSADRNGRGGFLAPVRGADGLVSAPTFSWTNEPATGLYRVGAGAPAMSVSGIQRQSWSTTGTSVNGVAAVSGNATVGGTLGVTGLATVGGTFGATGVSTLTGGWTTGAAAPATAGDGRLQRSGDAAQGVVHFGSGNTHYLWWNGTRFALGDGPDKLSVGTPSAGSDAATMAYVDAGVASAFSGAAVVSGRIVPGVNGACQTAGRASPSATCNTSVVGTYVVTVASVTSTATIVATRCGSTSHRGFVEVVPAAGTFTVKVWEISASGVYSAPALMDDGAVCFSVVAL